jgi:hypothetical protein
MSRPAIEVAIENLKVIGSEIDPLYRPARYMLGHAYLLNGDAINAVQVFQELIKEFEETASHSIDKLRAEWTRRPPRLVNFAKRIPFIHLWLQRWVDITRSVIGGDLYRAAQAWDEIKKAVSEQDQSVFGVHLLDFNLNINLRALEDFPTFQKLAEIAVGRRPAEERTPSQAREFLDMRLDLDKIGEVDHQLKWLTTDCELLESHAGLKEILDTRTDDSDRLENALQKIEELKKTFLGVLPGLERLQNALREERWSDAKGEIRGLRALTEEPSVFALMRILSDPAVDSLGARIAEFFIPALRLVRQERAYGREPLYLETVYHLALAQFLTFEKDSLRRVFETIDNVQKRSVRPSWPFPYRIGDLEVLIVCLDVQTSSYDYSKTSDGSSGYRLGEAEEKWKAELSRVAESKKRRPEIRAAALTSLVSPIHRSLSRSPGQQSVQVHRHLGESGLRTLDVDALSGFQRPLVHRRAGDSRPQRQRISLCTTVLCDCLHESADQRQRCLASVLDDDPQPA